MQSLRRLLRGGRRPEYHGIPSQDPTALEGVHEYLENLSIPSNALPGNGSASGRQRDWLVIDKNGNCSSIVVDKHELVANLGIHYRDLRIVDPHVPTPYPSGIFIREKAIVLNLESIRSIICKDRVYILSVPSPGKPLNCATTLTDDNFFVKDLLARVGPAKPGLPVIKTSIDRQLPFELRAMESALAAAVRTLEIETMMIEKQTGPALSKLMQKVTRKELNTVRHSKTAVTKLLARISRIKKELEDLLDDDEDMRDLYLRRREEQKLAAEASAKEQGNNKDSEEETEALGGDIFSMESLPGHKSAARLRREPFQRSEAAPADSAPQPILAPGIAAEAIPATTPVAMSAPAADLSSLEQRVRRKVGHWSNLQDLTTLVGVLRGLGPSAANLHLGNVLDPNDISGCESMLEAYFLQVDYLLARLSSLEGRISGTEDQLNIEMDHRRNELQALDLAITAFMSSLAFISMIGGVYGMNLKNGFEESQVAFYTTVAVTGTVAFILLLGILLYARSKRLLFIPYTM